MTAADLRSAVRAATPTIILLAVIAAATIGLYAMVEVMA